MCILLWDRVVQFYSKNIPNWELHEQEHAHIELAGIMYLQSLLKSLPNQELHEYEHEYVEVAGTMYLSSSSLDEGLHLQRAQPYKTLYTYVSLVLVEIIIFSK